MEVTEIIDKLVNNSLGFFQLANFMLISFLGLFTIVDPIGNVPIFLSVTAQSREAKSRIAFRAVSIAFIIFVLIIFTGSMVFNFLGISMSALKISGGVVIFLYALQMINGEEETKENDSTSAADVAVIPLAIPLLAGPGSITTLIVLGSKTDSMIGYLILVAMSLIVLTLTWLVFAKSEAMLKVLGPRGIAITNKIMGLIIAAIAVQFMLDGVIEIWPGSKA